MTEEVADENAAKRDAKVQRREAHTIGVVLREKEQQHVDAIHERFRRVVAAEARDAEPGPGNEAKREALDHESKRFDGRGSPELDSLGLAPLAATGGGRQSKGANGGPPPLGEGGGRGGVLTTAAVRPERRTSCSASACVAFRSAPPPPDLGSGGCNRLGCTHSSSRRLKSLKCT